MQPPYELNQRILHLCSQISLLLGEIRAIHKDIPSPQLRKKNRIQTIQSSLAIEGNTLSEAQITALVDEKRVLGPPKDILEVQNAIDVYKNIGTYQPENIQHFLKAHGRLLKGLDASAGSFRTKGVGIVKGDVVQHYAPPHDQVPFQIKALFDYLRHSKDLALIKSCVVHYEIEFIHPFMDGNGRMGRLWQSLILLQEHAVFEYLPFEHMIQADQDAYYKALSLSDKSGHSTPFIEYMLQVILDSLQVFAGEDKSPSDTPSRVQYFLNTWTGHFARKDYLSVFKQLSPASASRDLKWALDNKLIVKHGAHNQSHYCQA